MSQIESKRYCGYAHVILRTNIEPHNERLYMAREKLAYIHALKSYIANKGIEVEFNLLDMYKLEEMADMPHMPHMASSWLYASNAISLCDRAEFSNICTETLMPLKVELIRRMCVNNDVVLQVCLEDTDLAMLALVESYAALGNKKSKLCEMFIRYVSINN